MRSRLGLRKAAHCASYSVLQIIAIWLAHHCRKPRQAGEAVLSTPWLNLILLTTFYRMMPIPEQSCFTLNAVLQVDRASSAARQSAISFPDCRKRAKESKMKKKLADEAEIKRRRQQTQPAGGEESQPDQVGHSCFLERWSPPAEGLHCTRKAGVLTHRSWQARCRHSCHVVVSDGTGVVSQGGSHESVMFCVRPMLL